MLRARILTALALLFALLAVLFFAPWWGWLAFLGVIAFGAGWEWVGLMHGPSDAKGARWAFGSFLAILIALCGLGRWEGLTGVFPAGIFAISVLFWLLLVPNWLRRKWVLPAGLSGYAMGVVVCAPAILALLVIRAQGPWVLLAVLAAVWMADIAAFFAGRRFGKRKLAPEISPGKSWEGVFGAMAAVAIYCLVVAAIAGMELASPLHVLGVLVASLVFVGLSVEGDLFESMLKRKAGLKDSGALLPGHGGILDRVDSLTSTLPVVALAILVHRSL